MISGHYSIHAHFYQPPREDPLTGIIPIEEGAAPYSNWNERIHAECYQPNTELGNFSRISYNIGPTLMRWMERHETKTYLGIVAQDRVNYDNYGVGNAIAQAFNHTILPLSGTRDKITQISWGIAAFEHTFGRKPRGMWLPETAVDMETLEILADFGIEFTILAPWQAKAERIDASEPYRVLLSEGRQVTVFFYHPQLSSGISFDPSLTVNADHFVRFNLIQHLNQQKLQFGEPQMLLLASDGELYGHHQPLRELFLARLVDGAGSLAGLENIYPALWLKKYPPRKTISILEGTSWSCHHGIKRWTGECDCTPGNGKWKFTLRRVMVHLAAKLDELFEKQVMQFGLDPWRLRREYIHVMLGKRTFADLLAEQAGLILPQDEVDRLHVLLESQKERQLMFTSCGWFFEDFQRIEPQNNVAYAAKAVHLARLATGVYLGDAILPALELVSSNRTSLRADGVFRNHARQLAIFLPDIPSSLRQLSIPG
ncbi:MAG TPA: DUF3536 domain-containing protein [Anaerolineales bacterium]|nr:DUF3536 domain-containing protein [Anaerolineales bacterium]